MVNFIIKSKYFAKFGIYICICHFFFVTLRPNLLCVYVCLCVDTREMKIYDEK